MCVIYFAPDEDKRPPLSELKDGELCNPDGGGFAYFNEEKVPVWRKGLDADDISDALKNISGPVMIHFRIASVGERIPALTHPFPIDRKAPVNLEGVAKGGLLFQNGTWTGWRSSGLVGSLEKGAGRLRLPDRGPWSDTRALAWLASVYGPEWLDFADHSSKLGVMLPGGEAYIIGSEWHHVKRGGREWYQSSHTFPKSTSRSGTSWDQWTGHGSTYDGRDERSKKQKEVEETFSRAPLLPAKVSPKVLKKVVDVCEIKISSPEEFSDKELVEALGALAAAQVPVAAVN